MTAVAFTMVIGVLTFLMGFINGLKKLTQSSGNPENVIVLSQGATDEGISNLPFENMGATEDGYFADGVTEEIRGKLAAIPGLRVTARTSSRQYKGTKETPTTVGSELGVQYLLTGTIQVAVDGTGRKRVRVTPELIKVSDGSTTWQQPFDAVLSDVFTVQSEIATLVASGQPE